MEPQSKSNPQSRNEEVKGGDQISATGSNGSADLATTEQQPAPFSEFDPFRASRIAALNSETAAFCELVGVEPTGLENATEAELRQFYKDAEERAGWSQTRQDVFAGFVRMGLPTPPRTKRIL
jgi:hypothetical protein